MRAIALAFDKMAEAVSRLIEAVSKVLGRFAAAAYAAIKNIVRIVPREQAQAIQIECCYRVARLRSLRVAAGEGMGGSRRKRRAVEIDAEVLERVESLASKLRIAESWFDSASDHVDELADSTVLQIAESSGYLDVLIPELVVCEVMAC